MVLARRLARQNFGEYYFPHDTHRRPLLPGTVDGRAGHAGLGTAGLSTAGLGTAGPDTVPALDTALRPRPPPVSGTPADTTCACYCQDRIELLRRYFYCAT